MAAAWVDAGRSPWPAPENVGLVADGGREEGGGHAA